MRDEIKSLVMVHANIFSLRIYFKKLHIDRNVNSTPNHLIYKQENKYINWREKGLEF